MTSSELATDWSANADATEWTFNLRKGVKFHDGSDFDAEDVKYSLMRVKDQILDLRQKHEHCYRYRSG